MQRILMASGQVQKVVTLAHIKVMRAEVICISFDVAKVPWKHFLDAKNAKPVLPKDSIYKFK